MNNNQQVPSMHPLFKRAIEMTNGKTPAEMEQAARNICQQKGISFDDAIKAFQLFCGGNAPIK